MNPAKICGAVAAAIAMVCVVPAFGEEVDVPVEDMHGNSTGNINVTTNDDADGPGSILASFDFPEGKDAAATAEALWGDHLNWVNVVVSGTPGSTPDDPDGDGKADFPMLDPLPGGNDGASFTPLDADDLPFYLDENNDNDDGGASALDLSDNIFDEFLLFEDAPVFNSEVTWKFNTYLTAINGEANASDTDKTFHLIAGFMWTYTEDDMGNREITNLMAITIDGETIGDHLTLVNIAMDDHDATKDWQATSHIPEPATLGLLLPIVLMRRRRFA